MTVQIFDSADMIGGISKGNMVETYTYDASDIRIIIECRFIIVLGCKFPIKQMIFDMDANVLEILIPYSATKG